MPSQVTLAFDFGLRRIGVAQGSGLLKIALPLTTIQGKNNQEKFKKINNLIKEWLPEQLVVGIPYSLEGEENENTERCVKFAHRLAKEFKLPVYLVDERYSSSEAQQRLYQADINSKKQRLILDQVSAVIILETFWASTNSPPIILPSKNHQ